jgi:two-component system response regulator AtoC
MNRKSMLVAAHGIVTASKAEAVSEAPPVLERLGDVEDLADGGFLVLASPQMRKLRAQVSQVARVDVPVLILGESGTGKEVIAKLLHSISPRSQRPFLKVNCAAVPGELLESELFGYERGAFTGAVRSKPGIFEACNHGTLFLDEIAEMPPALQAKLLHVLQDQGFSRLGSSARIKTSVRIVAATNVDIQEAISSKAFRADLYYRLSTFVFSIPPLRDRKEDVPILLQRYLAHYANRLGLPARPIRRALWELCMHHNWPGNVRELENFAKRYLICGEEEICLPSGDMEVRSAEDANSGDLKAQVGRIRNAAEASVISRALVATKWNRKEAAKLLNISYKSILSKIRLYGLNRVSDKALSEYVSDGRAVLGTSGHPDEV